MSIPYLHRVTVDSAFQTNVLSGPSRSFQASNHNTNAPTHQNTGSVRSDGMAIAHSRGDGVLGHSLLPPNSVMIPTASMKRKLRDSDRPGVPTGTAGSARALFNLLFQQRMGRARESIEEDFPVYNTMANSIKDEIRSFLYHRVNLERETRTYSSVKKEFLSKIMHLKRKLSETYPVLAAAQGGWVSNEFLKEAIQRDKKAAAEAVKRMKNQAAKEPSGSVAMVHSHASLHGDQVQHSGVHLNNCVDQNKNSRSVDRPPEVHSHALEVNGNDELPELSGVDSCMVHGHRDLINNAVTSDDQNELDEEDSSDQSIGEDQEDSEAAKEKDVEATGHFEDDENDDVEIPSSGLQRKKGLQKQVTEKLSREPLKHVVRHAGSEGESYDDESEIAEPLIRSGIAKKQPIKPLKPRSVSGTEASKAQMKGSKGNQGSRSGRGVNRSGDSHKASRKRHRNLSNTTCTKRPKGSSGNRA